MVEVAEFAQRVLFGSTQNGLLAELLGQFNHQFLLFVELLPQGIQFRGAIHGIDLEDVRVMHFTLFNLGIVLQHKLDIVPYFIGALPPYLPIGTVGRALELSRSNHLEGANQRLVELLQGVHDGNSSHGIGHLEIWRPIKLLVELHELLNKSGHVTV